MSGRALFRVVVSVVFACGAAALFAGLAHLVRTGTVNAQIAAGLIYIGLAIWLYRGSNAARIVVAVFFAIGVVSSVVIALFVVSGSPTATVVWLVLAAATVAVLWALLMSKPFRTELNAQAEKYRKPEPTPG